MIYDEVHLLPAPGFRMTAAIQARRRLGLTATLVREDGREGDVFSLIGPKRYDVHWKKMERTGFIAQASCREIRIALGPDDRARYLAAELSADWPAEARAAMEGKRDLWIRLAGERRLRLVTPHRVAAGGGGLALEARVHDSRDLRAFRGETIEGAAPGSASDPENLSGAGGPVAALRAARNDKCPCGSGRKYKHCCLPSDLAASGG